MPVRKRMGPKLRRIKMLLLDVDGVMTDGGIYYSADGVELKRFNAHDGYGVVRAREHGLLVGLVSGRNSPIVTIRAREMNVDDVALGVEDKVKAMEGIRLRHHLEKEHMAFVGDDLFDIPLLRLVGFSAAPKNARPEVKRAVDYVTRVAGGDGAVREVIDLILAHQTVQRKT